MTTAKKESCCCSRNGQKKAHCQPFTITLLTCPDCGLMYNKMFKDCPQCCWDKGKDVKSKKKEG